MRATVDHVKCAPAGGKCGRISLSQGGTDLKAYIRASSADRKARTRAPARACRVRRVPSPPYPQPPPPPHPLRLRRRPRGGGRGPGDSEPNLS